MARNFKKIASMMKCFQKLSKMGLKKQTQTEKFVKT
jgi:hypothetical protein